MRESRSRAACLAVVTFLCASSSALAQAQDTLLLAYHPPKIALAQPAAGTALPQDKAIGVFRFASTEPQDPIDALSFSVTVDGSDRTALFRLAEGEAWGSFAPDDAQLGLGQHEVSARVCTSRGACSSLKTAITVVEAQGAPAKNGKTRSKVIDMLMQALRSLLG